MYFPNVNLLRACAALLVLVYHVIELVPWPEFPAAGAMLTFRAGWVGVDLFFVISGFVIGLSAITLYRDGERDYRRTFVRRRLARIVPLYLFTGAVFLVLVHPSVLSLPWQGVALQLGSHLLFLHNLHPSLHGAINGPNWTVAAEMQFYVLVTIAAPLLSRIDVRWLMAGGVLIAWASRALAFFATRDLGDTHLTFVYATQVPSMLDAFAVGILIARLNVDGTLQDWTARFGLLPLLSAGCILFVAALYFVWGSYWANAVYWNDASMVIFWRTGLALTFGALVLVATLLPDIARFVPPLDYLGDISYGIYMWHLTVILTLKTLLPEAMPVHLFWMTLTIVIVLSAATWHFLERPIIRRFR